jgi:TRAP-type C4-dicarboxylate transport system permease large subunit
VRGVGLVFFAGPTATEAAAIGAAGGFILMVANRTATAENIRASFTEALSSTIMILAIVLGAHVFGHFITETQVTPAVVDFMAGMPISPLAIVALIALGYLVLGFFMDQLAIIALTVPVTLPVISELGFDPVWFGVVVVLLAEVGMITPPLGLNVFVVSKAAKLPVETVFWGTAPFALAICAVGAVLFLVPDIVLFLPTRM